jgi:hypothetical protein
LLPDPKTVFQTCGNNCEYDTEEKGFLNHETTKYAPLFPVISREEHQQFALKDVVSQYLIIAP